MGDCNCFATTKCRPFPMSLPDVTPLDWASGCRTRVNVRDECLPSAYHYGSQGGPGTTGRGYENETTTKRKLTKIKYL